MKNPIAHFDMDGTLFDFHGKLLSDLELLRSPNERMVTNLFDDLPEWIKNRMNLIKGRPGWWRDLPKLQLGWDVYEMAKETGFSVKILTKGPRTDGRNPEIYSHHATAWAEKVQCIDKHFGPNVGISIVCQGKPSVYGLDKKDVYGRVLVEDFPEYLEGWLEHRKRGLGIIIDNPSNRGFLHPNVVRYDGTEEAKLKVKKALRAAHDRLPKQHWKDIVGNTSE